VEDVDDGVDLALGDVGAGQGNGGIHLNNSKFARRGAAQE
jgi:hypothetical protein